MEYQTLSPSATPAIITAEPSSSPAETTLTTASVPAEFPDSRIPTYFRDFLQGEKPRGIGPTEVAYVSMLLAFKAIDQPVTFSHQTIAQMLGCGEKTVKRAEKVLRSRGWIVTESRRGRSKLTSVSVDRLPTVDHGLPKRPTANAEELRKRYLAELVGRRLRFPHKRQLKTIDWSAQKLLNRCGGDLDLATRMVVYALDDPGHAKAARAGLFKLWKRWKLVEKSFAVDTAPPASSYAISDEAFEEIYSS